MALIDVAQAEAGMTLSGDILDKRGRVLIPSGAELKAKHLSALPAWGVTHIEVDGGDVGGAAEVEDWALSAADELLDTLFAHCNVMHPPVAALKEICAQRAAVRIQAEGQGGGG